MNGIQRGDLQPYSPHNHSHGHVPQQQHETAAQQQEPQQTLQYSSSNSSGETAAAKEAIGSGNLGFMGVAGSSQQHMYKKMELIPKSNMLVPDLPSGTLVLALNLMAYWAITKQSRRGGFGGV